MKLTIQDLNTTINCEPRLEDLLVAKRLGFKRPRAIRQLIDANKEELETYGSIATAHGAYRGKQFTTYFLNEEQALLLCMFSRTENAKEARKNIIAVYQAYRKGTLQPLQHNNERDYSIYGTETVTVLKKPYEMAVAAMEALQSRTKGQTRTLAECGSAWLTEGRRLAAALPERNHRRVGVCA